MTDTGAILVLGCGDAAISALVTCLEPRGVSLSVVTSPTELVREVVSRMPVAIVIGVRPAADSDLDAIEMVHAINGELPVVVIASADSIELERRVRQAGIFYYVVEPPQMEELEAVIDDVLRYTAESH